MQVYHFESESSLIWTKTDFYLLLCILRIVSFSIHENNDINNIFLIKEQKQWDINQHFTEGNYQPQMPPASLQKTTTKVMLLY